MFVNLCPHPIHLPDGRTIEPIGYAARCQEITHDLGLADGIPLVTKRYGAVENLPDPRPGLWFIVSMMVRLACPERTDIVSPGDPVRDDEGNVFGCLNLVMNSLNP